jgi:hypothetical protein
VPLVEQVAHGEHIVQAIDCVDGIRDGDIPHAMLYKIFFEQRADNQSVSSKPRVVFDDDGLDRTVLHTFHHFHKRRSVEANACPSIIHKDACVVKTVVLCVLR